MTKKILGWLRELAWIISLLDWFKKNWVNIVVFYTAVPIVSYLAYLSNWMEEYGAIAWVFSGLTALLIISVVLIIFARLQLYKVESKILTRYRLDNRHIVNPMDSNFNNKRISLASLASPIDENIKSKSFSECEIIGPAIVLCVDQTVVTHCEMLNCNYIKLNEIKTPMYHTTGLVRCNFNNCTFFNVTFLVNANQAAYWEANGGAVNWLAG